jgi:hypothetical protein
VTKAQSNPATDLGPAAADFTPATLRPRHDGWTAERQRTFLQALAETGSVTDAARLAGVAPRSAYRLRAHPEARAFAAAWDWALKSAAGTLTAVAFERAIHGARHEKWKDGELVGETRTPSDRMLMFLLKQFDRKNYGAYRWIDAFYDKQVGHATDKLPAELDRLADLPGDIGHIGLFPDAPA